MDGGWSDIDRHSPLDNVHGQRLSIRHTQWWIGHTYVWVYILKNKFWPYFRIMILYEGSRYLYPANIGFHTQAVFLYCCADCLSWLTCLSSIGRAIWAARKEHSLNEQLSVSWLAACSPYNTMHCTHLCADVDINAQKLHQFGDFNLTTVTE